MQSRQQPGHHCGGRTGKTGPKTEKERDRFYITEHGENINEQMRSLGIGHLIREGMVRRTIVSALHDLGLREPFPLDIPEKEMEILHKRHFYSLTPEEENSLEEFAWVFGADAVKEIEKQVKYVVRADPRHL